MGINLERRLQRISEALNKGHSLLRDMSDDELAQVITGNQKPKPVTLPMSSLRLF